jgi:hypothetical protein
MHSFSDYIEWRRAITVRCGLELTAAYCQERVQAQTDDSAAGTANFVATYGEDFLRQVIGWFRRAGEEAVS